MDFERAESLLKRVGQSHLLDYYDELDDEKRSALLGDIGKLDFSVVSGISRKDEKRSGRLTPVAARTLDDISLNFKEYESVGLDALKAGKVAAVLLAGGQGTRLGYDKPKGTFDMGVTRTLTIFGIHMQRIKNVAARAGVSFPLFIMTSEKNDAETRACFAENSFFGYPQDKIFFFVQDTEPACDYDGKIFLAEKHRVALSPNGNGGWYGSLVKSGLRKVLDRCGAEWINLFGVDNVLQNICDPAFIGAAILSGCACSAKVVKKACAEEKVGVLCNEDGKPTVIEYYDMPEELASMRGADGELVFRYGVILNNLFKVESLDLTLGESLPYHLAEKAIPHIENGVKVTPDKPNGYKFEKLVVDMIKLTGSCLAYEVERRREFAPVKNKSGVDSVDTARRLLEENGFML